MVTQNQSSIIDAFQAEAAAEEVIRLEAEVKAQQLQAKKDKQEQDYQKLLKQHTKLKRQIGANLTQLYRQDDRAREMLDEMTRESRHTQPEFSLWAFNVYYETGRDLDGYPETKLSYTIYLTVKRKGSRFTVEDRTGTTVTQRPIDQYMRWAAQFADVKVLTKAIFQLHKASSTYDAHEAPYKTLGERHFHTIC